MLAGHCMWVFALLIAVSVQMEGIPSYQEEVHVNFSASSLQGERGREWHQALLRYSAGGQRQEAGGDVFILESVGDECLHAEMHGPITNGSSAALCLPEPCLLHPYRAGGAGSRSWRCSCVCRTVPVLWTGHGELMGCRGHPAAVCCCIGWERRQLAERQAPSAGRVGCHPQRHVPRPQTWDKTTLLSAGDSPPVRKQGGGALPAP